MPLVNFNSSTINFTFEEANKLASFMEKIAGYGGHKSGKTAFQVMEEFDVLEAFTKLRDIVRYEYDD